MSPNLVPGPVSTPEFSIFSLELCPGSLFFHANSRPQYGVADFRISGPGPGLESQLPFLFFQFEPGDFKAVPDNHGQQDRDPGTWDWDENSWDQKSCCMPIPGPTQGFQNESASRISGTFFLFFDQRNDKKNQLIVGAGWSLKNSLNELFQTTSVHKTQICGRLISHRVLEFSLRDFF